MAKPKKKPEKTELCPDCLRMFSPQGIVGHRRWAHGEPSPAQEQLPLEPKREPTLIKPALPTDLLVEALGEGELADYKQTSPCCSARLRSAVRVLGIADRALKNCFICSRCGEWYLYEPEGYLQVYKDGSRGVQYLEHLPQKPNPDIGSIFQAGQ